MSSNLCLSPESYEVMLQAGLLAHPVLAAFPFHTSLTVARFTKTFSGFTAAGTAPVSHGIPFSPLSEKLAGEPEIAI